MRKGVIMVSSYEKTLRRFCLVGMAALILVGGLLCQEAGKARILQEMSWTDVRDYLKTEDMVIIPLGSIEQHGPHLPLGTDCYQAFGMAGLVSEQTGVVVAPILWLGYSVYHSGFAGSLSLKPETLAQVLFETAEMLIKYGFRRFMFFNYHGGNRLAEQKVIHRINHSTDATAVSIGIGGAMQTNLGPPPAPFDQHAGIGETSNMLYLRPDLVRMERAEKPEITFSAEMQKIMKLAERYAALNAVLGTMMAVPEETGKGGASHELSSNGIWTMGDPRDSTRELGEKKIRIMVKNAVDFIQAWKKVK
jgi:creatinine amidohydrolase